MHAPQSRTHNKGSQSGDSFADLLATADAAQPGNKNAPTRERAPVDTSKSDRPAAKEKTAAQDETARNEEAADTNPDQAAGDARATEAEAAADSNSLTLADAGAPVTDDKPANDNALPDPAAALPQQPAPQPVVVAAPVVASANPVSDISQDNAEGETIASEAAIAPAATNNGKAAPKAPQGEEIPAADESVDAAPEGTTPPVRPAVTGKKAATASEAPQAAATAAAKPSAEINSISLVTPTAAPTAVPQGVEKPVVTARAEAPPQAAPNVNQMAVDVAARSQSGARQFDIRLDPPELGRVEVRLSIDAHGKAEAHLTADQPQTLDLLQKDAPALARALRDAGLNVAQDGLNFSLKQQQQHYAGGDDPSRQGARHGFNGGRSNNETSQPDEGAYVRRSLGVLDIRV